MNHETKTILVTTSLPEQIVTQAQKLVDAGWVRNMDDLLLDALRRYLESHREDWMEATIRQDIEWGLHGDT